MRVRRSQRLEAGLGSGAKYLEVARDVTGVGHQLLPGVAAPGRALPQADGAISLSQLQGQERLLSLVKTCVQKTVRWQSSFNQRRRRLHLNLFPL